MKELLTPEGYEQTKEKLRYLELRLVEVEKHTDLTPARKEAVRRSSKTMMRKLMQDIKLYETHQAKQKPMPPA